MWGWGKSITTTCGGRWAIRPRTRQDLTAELTTESADQVTRESTDGNDREQLVTLIDGNVDDSVNTEDVSDATPAAPALTDTSKSVASTSPAPSSGGMRVRKRNGALEPVDLNKIVNAIARASEGLDGVDPMRVATRTISGARRRRHHDASSTSCRSAPPPRLIVEEPNYSRLAARLLATVIDKEVRNQNIHVVLRSRSRVGHRAGLDRRQRPPRLSQPTPASSTTAIDSDRDLRSSSTSACAPSTTATCCATPSAAQVIETPQYFFLRVACGLADRRPERGDRALPT